MTPSCSPAGPRLPLAVALPAACVGAVLCIAHMVIGSIYQDECPREPHIPIYLQVMGALSLLLVLFSFLPCCDNCRICSALVYFVACAWFITGNVWVYSIYKPNYNKTSTDTDPYCDKTLYLFSFWSINAAYILAGLIAAFSFCKFTLSQM